MADEQQLTIEARDEMFNILCSMSDRQVDPIVKNRLKTLLGRPHLEIKDELLGVIDDACYGSLTSNFEIMVMDKIWRSCGGTQEELDNRDTSDTPANREKYKWHR